MTRGVAGTGAAGVALDDSILTVAACRFNRRGARVVDEFAAKFGSENPGPNQAPKFLLNLATVPGA